MRFGSGAFVRALALAGMLATTASGAPSEKKPSFDAQTVVFIGSSTIHKWSSLAMDFPGIKTLNLGEDGSDFGFLIAHAPEWAVKYPASRYVIYSGDNDIAAGKSPEDVARDFKITIGLLREKLPATKLFVFSIKPSPTPERKAKLAQIAAANKLLREVSSTEKNVVFIDVFPQMITPNGVPREDLFIDDGLHMNASGYSIWTKALRPLLTAGQMHTLLDLDLLRIRALRLAEQATAE